ncbi:putative TAM domain methyltransferase [Taphrina deformans PYCC 5710]|uniref:TAM domain methyltransferase n=1 Tax=Taphrina deformans (strain PYCC 5710 / ATCC 11124 / CBS 356.35 / IMI 108563 / JCM 9778 / NBRC 8474) TaxID=1097556 RepID=R4X6G0_TAPDE|nr:putative TAM domain methyltransferase [Taphrina deformans PYCC 5710]|eukprot:CCG80660.1 putative TAM domain methyltransferase [Taphrina deformans PYCC 5710]
MNTIKDLTNTLPKVKESSASHDIIETPCIHNLNKSHERIITWDKTDLREYGRLERRHEIVKALLDDRLHQAPILNPRRILDCSSGSGCWALEACARYPAASVTGLDMSNLQCLGPLSDRLQFCQGRLDRDLPFADCTFDLVHSQAVQSQVSDWSAFVSELYRVTTPGGWVQLVEPDADGVSTDEHSTGLGDSLTKWINICNYASVMMGHDTAVHLKLVDILTTIGFENIQSTDLKARSFVPEVEGQSAGANKIVAKLIKRDMTESVRNCGKDALQVLSTDQSEEEIQRFIQDVVKDFKRTTNKWYLGYRAIVAQKPV